LDHPEDFVIDKPTPGWDSALGKSVYAKKIAEEKGYDAYNDPYMMRYLSKGSTIKQLVKTGLIDDVTRELKK